MSTQQEQLTRLREDLRKVNERLDAYPINHPGDDLFHELLDRQAELQEAIWNLGG